MSVPEFDDFAVDGQQSRIATLERALELVDLLLSELIAAANPPSQSYRGDSVAYRHNRNTLGRILTPMGIQPPFPWSSLDQSVAAAKAAHSGSGSYRWRRAFFTERAERVTRLLRTRLDDQAAGDLDAAVAEFAGTAASEVQDSAAVRAELARWKSTRLNSSHI